MGERDPERERIYDEKNQSEGEGGKLQACINEAFKMLEKQFPSLEKLRSATTPASLSHS